MPSPCLRQHVVMHGLYTQFNGFDRKVLNQIQATGIYGIRTRGKADAVDLIGENKLLRQIQVSGYGLFVQSQKIAAEKGNLGGGTFLSPVCKKL